MVLYLIGIGLGDEEDITVKGLRLVQQADVVFLEAYTSLLPPAAATASPPSDPPTAGALLAPERLEQFYGRAVRLADRELVEQRAEEEILDPAQQGSVAFLVVGDALCATTHTDLWIRATQRHIAVQVIHNASIMTTAGPSCGLQLYKFGQTVSLPFFEPHWRPTSFYEKILYNRRGGLHTLCLLDIKVQEPDYQALIQRKGGSGGGSTSTTSTTTSTSSNSRRHDHYLPPRFMSMATAIEQLMEAEATHQQGAYQPDRTLCVGLARVGSTEAVVRAGTMRELSAHDFGAPLHSLILCADPEHVHDLEWALLQPLLINPHSPAFSPHHNTTLSSTSSSSSAVEQPETPEATVPHCQPPKVRDNS